MGHGPVKILLAKAGLDGHDRGIRVVANALRDSGMEVVYAGLRQTPEMIAEAALQEDVAAVGISMLSAAHMTLLPRVRTLLDDRDMKSVVLVAGGIFPPDDVRSLSAMGIGPIFGPGTPMRELAKRIESAIGERTSAA